MPAHVLIRLTLLAVLTTSVAIPKPAWSEDWRKFSPQDGGFQVELPGPPVTTTRSQWQPVGKIVSTVYKTQIHPDTFGLSVTDLPRVTFAFRSRDKIVETTAEGFVEDANARLTGSGPVQLDGHTAKEIRYEIPATESHPLLHGVSRMLIDDKRLYIFYVEVSEKTPKEDVERYFASVRISDDPAPSTSD